MYMHIKYHTVHFTYPTISYVNFTLMSEVKVAQLCLTFCDPPLYSPWNSPGQNTGVGNLFLYLNKALIFRRYLHILGRHRQCFPCPHSRQAFSRVLIIPLSLSSFMSHWEQRETFCCGTPLDSVCVMLLYWNLIPNPAVGSIWDQKMLGAFFAAGFSGLMATAWTQAMMNQPCFPTHVCRPMLLELPCVHEPPGHLVNTHFVWCSSHFVNSHFEVLHF